MKRAEKYVEAKGWAGAIFDQQDDRGEEFAKIAAWWPSPHQKPELGVQRDSGTFAAKIKLASGEEVHAYPLDTPEDALASALFFYRFGLPRIAAHNKTAAHEVERVILDALNVHSVALPEGYKRACYEAISQEIKPEREEVWAGQGLPVTTPEQTLASLKVFDQYRDRYSAPDQIKIANKLKRAAQSYGIEWDSDLSKYASLKGGQEVARPAASVGWAIDKRIKIAQHLDHSLTPQYLEALERIKVEAELASNFGAIVKVASDLEQADLMVSLHTSWNEYIPDPARSVVVEHEVDPREHFKRARDEGKPSNLPKWERLDLDQIERDGFLSGNALDALRKNAALANNLAPELQTLLARYIT